MNRPFACADDSTLCILGVVRKPAGRPAVAASLNRDLAGIQEWFNHRCTVLNPNKTNALVVCRSRTASPPHGDLVLSGVSIWASPNLDIFGLTFDSKLTFEDHMYVRGIVSSFSQRSCILGLVNHALVDTSVILRCYYAFVLPILEFYSPVQASAVWCHQLLERQVYSLVRLCPYQTFCRCVINVMLLDSVCCERLISNSNRCLFRERE